MENLLYILYAALLLQAFYWFYFFWPLAKAGEKPIAETVGALKRSERKAHCKRAHLGGLPDLSIVLCARNEREALERNLPFLLRQQYPARCELLLVDDHSTDGTAGIWRKPDKKMRIPLRVLALEGAKPEGSGKKDALARGIEQAKYECILLIDADCRPATEHWAALMAAPLAEGKNLVLGYSPFEKREGLLNTFQRFEGLWTAMQYLGFALRQMPYMGVGRNMAYTKSLYREVGGFATHEDVPYGDDDLFVQEAVRRADYALCLQPGSFVWTSAPENLSAYLKQKRRHLSAARKYKFRDQVLLGLFSLSLVLQVGGGYLLMAFFPLQAGLALLLRYLFVLPMAARLCRRLAQPDLWKLWPLSELLLLFYLLLYSPVAAGLVRLKKWS